MPTYKSSVSIEATPDAVFAYVSDVRNLPTYFDRMTSAEPVGGEAVRVVADVNGEPTTGEAWFRTHEGHRHRIEWGFEGPENYHGWLEVDREGHVASVTVEVHTARVSDDEIDRALDRTLFALKAQVEAEG